LVFPASLSSPRRNRLQSRLWRHHLPLLLASFVSVAALYATRDYKDVLSRASFATAYPALVLLAITLLIGPWNWLRNRPNPVSSDLRRDIGIWAGILSILHTATGQCVHLRGRPWLYYVYGPNEHHAFPLRHDAFGFANHTGAVSALLVIALLATSNDYSLRQLKARAWKKLQQWNYVLFGLALAHGLLYQLGVEKQKPGFVALVIVCAAGTAALQALVFARRRAAGQT
jgi:methionine sulfoxide reductase heme-binding subunit